MAKQDYMTDPIFLELTDVYVVYLEPREMWISTSLMKGWLVCGMEAKTEEEAYINLAEEAKYQKKNMELGINGY